MKVQVDALKCEANARCVAAAPQVFELGDDDVSHVKLPDIPPDLKDAVDRAIRLCPRQAIAWVEG
ncbi:MAG TPA: ferredoxin [Dehalococcoidia bacterium]